MAARTILHVDMDAFFASVEQRDHPAWRGLPVIVGAGPHERGVVSTCSYEARVFGVRSAMPSRTAYEKCPHGIFVKPRMRVYQEVSAQVFEILGHYSPFVEGVSVDEAFLDISGTVHLFGDARTLGERLRAEVRAACGLTCSVGIAPNRLLAKIGSEEAKPDGLFVTPFGPDAIRAWLAPQPVRILWGVGRRTNELLAKYGYRTCGDLQEADPRFLARVLGEPASRAIRAHACGEDASAVVWEDEAEKSVSREHTFGVDEADRAAVRAPRRLRRGGLHGGGRRGGRALPLPLAARAGAGEARAAGGGARPPRRARSVLCYTRVQRARDRSPPRRKRKEVTAWEQEHGRAEGGARREDGRGAARRGRFAHADA